MDENIVISGAAMATCLGLDRQTTWEAVRAGRSGIKVLTQIESPLPAGADGGQCVDLPAAEHSQLPREVQYLKKILRDALLDAGFPDPGDGEFDLPCPAHRRAIVLGTTLHGIRSGGQFLRDGDAGHLTNFLATSVLRAASAGLGFAGPALTTCSACSSGLGSIGLGITLLQSGQADVVVAGGYEAIAEYAWAGFNSLRLVASGALRPFARDRGGMKVGEGYAILILERESDLRRRAGARVLAKILGVGESADSHHLTQPHPQGAGAARAIASALAQANLKPADIDLVAAHATGTPDNDAAEYAALKSTFADDLPRVPVVGFKSHLSHTLGAAGSVELILSASALLNQTVPPTSGVKQSDTDFAGLNLASGQPQSKSLRASMNLSLGFGGANTCVILAPPESASKTRESKPAREVLITGIGVVMPGAVGNPAFLSRISQPGERVQSDAPAVDEAQIARLLNSRRVRRMSTYVKLSLAAAMLAIEDARITDLPTFGETCSALLGTAHGSSPYCREYYGQIVKDGVMAANPSLFAEGVPNAAAAHLSLAAGIKGGCQTIIGSRTAGLDAIGLAAARIAAGQWDRAIVGAGEEFCSTLNSAYAKCGVYASTGAAEPFGSGTFASGCGAVAMILESRGSAQTRSARIRGTVRKYAAASPAEGKAIAATTEILNELAQPPVILSSANGTWIDRIESAAIRQHAQSAGRWPQVSSICGYLPECFSAGPLAAIAAVLLSGKTPALFGPGISHGALPACADADSLENFAALATDYTGLVAGLSLGLNRESLEEMS